MDNQLNVKKKYLQSIIPRLDAGQTEQMLLLVNKLNTASTPQKEASKTPDNADPYTEFMGMIGCENAKKQLNNMISAYRLRKIALQRNHPMQTQYYHAVFTGHPGCAKTTCARLFAKILANEGMLKTDKFAELSRADLCGRYQGETAKSVQSIFCKNKGGLIFIDEAYSLYEKDSDRYSYGEEAINELIVGLENNPDTVVIFAGYPDKMETFLNANPGLASRIPFRVTFDDYSAEQLLQISQHIAKQNGFSIAHTADEKLLTLFAAERQQKNFGNGRYVRNLIEEAIREKSRQLGILTHDTAEFADPERFSDETLFTLSETCFPTARPLKAPSQHRIGF